MTPADLRHIVQFLALPEGTKFVAVSADGEAWAYEEQPKIHPHWDDEVTGLWYAAKHAVHEVVFRAKPQSNWRELCISVEGE